MRRYFVIIETAEGFCDDPVNMATFLDSLLNYPGIDPVTVYTSLEDLNADHLLDALAGTRGEETP